MPAPRASADGTGPGRAGGRPLAALGQTELTELTAGVGGAVHVCGGCRGGIGEPKDLGGAVGCVRPGSVTWASP